MRMQSYPKVLVLMFIHGRAQGYNNSERALTADSKSLGDFRSSPRFCENLIYICFGLDTTCPWTLRYLVSEAIATAVHVYSYAAKRRWT